MGRIFSLRGTYSVADNANGQHENIFDYVSPDRSRGWKIKEAWIFPKSLRAEIGGSDGQLVCQAHLATDTWTIAAFDEAVDVTDNRQCAWSTNQYVLRAAGSDFIAPANGIPDCGRFVCDPDTIIVKELYIAATISSESTTSPTREWNYLIILEELSISPSESIMQQVKGIGQDVSA
jgi:hypothetical protein